MVRPLSLLLISLAGFLLPCSSVRAQLADVPLANLKGDFSSTRIQGNRDVYPQRQWLVVTRDPEGLNCRDDRGHVVAILAYGAVVDSNLSESDKQKEAIVVVAGSPWLKVSVHPFDLLRDLRPPERRNRPISCRVRANAAYVAPLNPDTLDPVVPKK